MNILAFLDQIVLNRIKRHKSLFLVAFLVLQAALFFIIGIAKESLWNDEGQTLAIAFSKGFSGALFNPFSMTNQPPLYYILLHLWGSIFGLSNTALRLPSALFMIACIPLLFHIGKKLNGKWAGFFACQFFIFSPYIISYAQEARPYALYCFLSLLSFYFLLFIFHTPQNTRNYKYFLYGIALFCMCMTHPYSVFVLMAHGFIGLVFFHKLGQARIPLVRTWLLTLSFLLPALLAIVFKSGLMKQFLKSGGNILNWKEGPGWREFINLPIHLISGKNFFFSSIEVKLFFTLLGLAILILCLKYLYFEGSRLCQICKNERTLALQHKFIGYGFLIIFLVFSIVFPILISIFYADVYLHRYFIAAAPILVLFIAVTLYMMQGSMAIHVLCLAILANSIPVTISQYRNFNKTQWQDVSSLLSKEMNTKTDMLLYEANYKRWGPEILEHYMTYERQENRDIKRLFRSMWKISYQGADESLENAKKLKRYVDSKNFKRLWLVRNLSPKYPELSKRFLVKNYRFQERFKAGSLSVWEGVRRSKRKL